MIEALSPSIPIEDQWQLREEIQLNYSIHLANHIAHKRKKDPFDLAAYMVNWTKNQHPNKARYAMRSRANSMLRDQKTKQTMKLLIKAFTDLPDELNTKLVIYFDKPEKSLLLISNWAVKQWKGNIRLTDNDTPATWMTAHQTMFSIETMHDARRDWATKEEQKDFTRRFFTQLMECKDWRHVDRWNSGWILAKNFPDGVIGQLTFPK